MAVSLKNMLDLTLLNNTHEAVNSIRLSKEANNHPLKHTILVLVRASHPTLKCSEFWKSCPVINPICCSEFHDNKKKSKSCMQFILYQQLSQLVSVTQHCNRMLVCWHYWAVHEDSLSFSRNQLQWKDLDNFDLKMRLQYFFLKKQQTVIWWWNWQHFQYQLEHCCLSDLIVWWCHTQPSYLSTRAEAERWLPDSYLSLLTWHLVFISLHR